MAKFLITGGAGFVGSHLTDQLVADGHNVVILDDLSNGSIENISHHKNVVLVKGSVTAIPSEISSQSYDGIFHLATHPRSFSLNDPLKDVEVNAKGMINVLEIAKKQNIKLVFTSNSGICGTPDYVPVDEKHKDKPSTPYDANKLVSEYYCKIYHNIYGVKCIIFRLATVYGTRQKVNLQLGWKPVLATLVTDVYNDNSPTINGTGKQTRDLIHVSDVVQGLVKGFNSKIDNAEVFLLSTNTETSVNDLLQLIFEIVGKKLDIKKTPANPGDIERMFLSYEKANKAVGFEPKMKLRDGIKNYLDWLKNKSNS